ncbi:hypothetical protein COY62_03245 [bacterium (Candidatus Howlettbacteria) CG_4_10_14_0_8_um_filter_40_9]|nr:MAG: hypothetical protein COY62_03245 [bacterium (Candidatus Howlettbacteria) CG_4_10_14_0_8_um_filter_40_9]
MDLDSAVFYSNNIEKIIPFYRDTLGFEVEYIQEDRFVSFIFPNGARLGIKQGNEEREIPGAQAIFISIESIDEYYSQIKEKGLEIYKEPVNQDWGKNFSILDPDKNKVLFVER